MSAAALRRLRLADAQSAIARKTGFAAWPPLARHVEQLRALEGTWEFNALEVDGRPMAPAMLAGSRILIDGDRFRSETPGATYEGVFNIDVEANPHGIDIEFVEGPEAGNTNFGIFRLKGDELVICLDMNGKGRPSVFRAAPASGHALEILCRASASRPQAVTGGKRARSTPPGAPAAAANPPEFDYVPSRTLERLQGEWTAVRIVQDGQALPPAMCAMGRRIATKNEIKVIFGGRTMIQALVRIHEGAQPIAVDYCNLAGPIKGLLQEGIMQWIGEEACFCMAPSGQPRPADFSCPAGSGRTLSQWRRQSEGGGSQLC